MIPFSKFLFFLDKSQWGVQSMVQIWCFIVINLVAALERTSLSKPAVLCAVTWPRYPELSSFYINCHIWGIIGGYIRYTPPHFQTHPYQVWINGGPRSEKRTRSASCDPWPRGWSRSKESASVVWAPSLRGSGRRKTWSPNGCVWKCCVPLNPMVLLIIIPFLNGYFIGNIAYFQTNPNGKVYCLICPQWKRTGWNVQRLGFETKHRHTEVTQPKKCNRHEVGFYSTGEYSPAP